MKNAIKASIFALALAIAADASAAMMFTQTLRVGSRGAQVSALQEILIAEGYLDIDAPTGTFGQMTKRAVMEFQKDNGLPAVGQVGSRTRAVLNAMDEAPVTTTPTTPSTTTPAVPAAPVVSNGLEGFPEVKISPTVVNNPNVQTSSNVNVYAFEVKAKQADISLERTNLEVSVMNSSSAENPSTLINKIYVKDGSTILQTIPVTSSTFSRDTSVTPNKYYIQLAGLGLRVPLETTKTLTIAVDSNSIDTDRTVSVGLYGSQAVRVVDGRGISNYNTSSIETRGHTFKKPGTSNVIAKDDAVTLYSTNYRINRNGNGAEKVLTSTFAIKSETGASKLTNVRVQYTSSDTRPSNIYLYDGATIVDAKSATTSPSGYVNFDLASYNISIAADVTKTFSVRVDMPSNTATGTIVSTKVTDVTYEKPNGTSETVTSLTIPAVTVNNYFAPVVPQFAKVSSTATVIKSGASGAVSGIEAKLIASVMPQGGSLNATMTAAVRIKNLTAGSSTVVYATGVFEGNPSTLAEGTTKNVEFIVSFPATSTQSGVYKATVDSIMWIPTNGTAVNQTAGFELMDSTTATI